MREMYVCVCVCVCALARACVCVWKKERERKGGERVRALILLFPPLFQRLFNVSQLFKDFKFNILCKLIMHINYYIARLIRLNSFIHNVIIDAYYIAKFMIVNLCRLLWFWRRTIQNRWYSNKCSRDL